MEPAESASSHEWRKTLVGGEREKALRAAWWELTVIARAGVLSRILQVSANLPTCTVRKLQCGSRHSAAHSPGQGLGPDCYTTAKESAYIYLPLWPGLSAATEQQFFPLWTLLLIEPLAGDTGSGTISLASHAVRDGFLIWYPSVPNTAWEDLYFVSGWFLRPVVKLICIFLYPSIFLTQLILPHLSRSSLRVNYFCPINFASTAKICRPRRRKYFGVFNVVAVLAFLNFLFYLTKYDIDHLGTFSMLAFMKSHPQPRPPFSNTRILLINNINRAAYCAFLPHRSSQGRHFHLPGGLTRLSPRLKNTNNGRRVTTPIRWRGL